MRVDPETRRLAVQALGEAPTTRQYERMAMKLEVPMGTLRSWVCRARKEAGTQPPPRTRNATERGVATGTEDRRKVVNEIEPIDTRVTAQQAETAARIVDGKSYRDIQEMGGPCPAVISRWRREPGFNAYLAEIQAAHVDAIQRQLTAHGKKAVVEPERLLSADEVRTRVCDYYACEHLEPLTQLSA
jgi:transposase-like protein